MTTVCPCNLHIYFGWTETGGLTYQSSTATGPLDCTEDCPILVTLMSFVSFTHRQLRAACAGALGRIHSVMTVWSMNDILIYNSVQNSVDSLDVIFSWFRHYTVNMRQSTWFFKCLWMRRASLLWLLSFETLMSWLMGSDWAEFRLSWEKSKGSLSEGPLFLQNLLPDNQGFSQNAWVLSKTLFCMQLQISHLKKSESSEKRHCLKTLLKDLMREAKKMYWLNLTGR